MIQVNVVEHRLNHISVSYKCSMFGRTALSFNDDTSSKNKTTRTTTMYMYPTCDESCTQSISMCVCVCNFIQSSLYPFFKKGNTHEKDISTRSKLKYQKEELSSNPETQAMVVFFKEQMKYRTLFYYFKLIKYFYLTKILRIFLKPRYLY